MTNQIMRWRIDQKSLRDFGILAFVGSVFVLLILCTLPVGGFAQDVTFELAGQFGGWMSSAALDETGNYALLAQGSGFVVLDVSNPNQIQPVASLAFQEGGDVRDIAVQGDTAYVALENNLQILDISNPLQPTILGSYDNVQFPSAIDVVGTIAYLASTHTLKIIDVSNPASPALLSSYNVRGSVADLAVVGNTAFIAQYGSLFNGLELVDVTDPANPSQHSTYDLPSQTNDAKAVTVAGSKAYLATKQAGVYILDVSNLANPNQIGHYDPSERCYDVEVKNNIAYVANRDNGLLILDVSDPANITALATTDGDWRAHQVVLFNQKAYVVQVDRGLRIFDVTVPTSPAVQGTFEAPSQVRDVRMSADGAYGYYSSPGKFWVTDMTNPVLPVPISRCDLASTEEFTDNWLFVADNTAYVAESDYGLEIIDVSDPFNPAVIGEYIPPSGGARDVFVTGNYAYVLADRLRIVDVSNPAAPVEVGSFDTPGDTRRIFVADSTAYVADGEAGLRLIDVSNPANPVEVSHIDPPAGYAANAVFVDDDRRAWVGSTKLGEKAWLQGYDISDPANPSLLVEQQLDINYVNDLDVLSPYIYAGGSLNVLQFWANQLTPLLNWAGVPVQGIQVRQHPTQPNTLLINIIFRSSYGSQIIRQNNQLGELARIEVSPGEATLTVGDDTSFTAKGYDENNNEVPIDPIWSTTGGTITSDGLYTATTVGDFTVTASVQGSTVTGTATVHVTPGELARIEVSPGEATLTVGDDTSFTAKGYDENDNEVPIDPIWSTTGGTITSDGLYTATEVGDFTVTASVEGSTVTGTATVHVTTTGVDWQNNPSPEKFALYQNYPNPFNPTTTIEYAVKAPCQVLLQIFDIHGREVMTLVDSDHQAGIYKVNFDASHLATGLYFYQIKMKDFVAVRKMVVLE